MKRVVLVLVVAGCHRSPSGLIDQHTNEARLLYPDLETLYAGDQGMYRGCGPNSGVCHNASEFPNLHTVGSILDSIGQPCNQKRTAADTVDDLCEPAGDTLAINGRNIEIAWVIPDRAADGTANPRRWRVSLREIPDALSPQLAIMRGEDALWHLDRYSTASMAGDDASVVVFDALPVNPDGSDPATALTLAFGNAGVPSHADAIRVGDPNRNGVFGAALDGRLIKPGDPRASYLLHRITDPSAGPLMPRANCCYWSLAAVRALWCWIDRLAADGSNAMAPIDYDSCSSSPDVDLLYPDPGPTCESSGMCPATVAIDDGARFPVVYANVLGTQCTGSTCHDRGEVAGVDFSSEARAFTTLRTKVVPGDPDASILYQRITPGMCTGTCEPMPLGRDPISEADRDVIRAWIEAGAPSE